MDISWNMINIVVVGSVVLWAIRCDTIMMIITPTIPWILLLCSFLAAATEVFRFPPLARDKVDLFLQSRSTSEAVTVPLTGIGHRGAATDVPENTIAALQHCVNYGAGAAEIDIGLTKDGVLVLMHDDSVDRTTNGTGYLSNINMSQLMTLDAASSHPVRAKVGVQRVPTLREAVIFAKSQNLKLFLDLKATDIQQTISKLAELYEEFPNLVDMTVVCSFSVRVIFHVRSHIPEALVALTHQHKVYQYTADGERKNQESIAHFIAYDMVLEWSHNTWLWYLIGNPIYIIHKSDISPNFVKLWASRGVHVIAWTVNDSREKEYFNYLGVPYMTDTLIKTS